MDTFSSVKTPKICDLIVQQIKTAILSGKIKQGVKLPTELELMKRFQVSRISVRAALRSLEAVGLVKIKHGSGVFVAELDSKPLTESLFSMLRIKNTTIAELSEARMIFEPSMARLAAERITPEELDNLEKNISQTSSALKEGLRMLASNLNIEFHSLIAHATHNTVVGLSMKTFFDVLKQMTLDITDDQDSRLNISTRAVNAHTQIIQAMRQRDPNRVHELMTNHIQRIQKGFDRIKTQS